MRCSAPATGYARSGQCLRLRLDDDASEEAEAKADTCASPCRSAVAALTPPLAHRGGAEKLKFNNPMSDELGAATSSSDEEEDLNE